MLGGWCIWVFIEAAAAVSHIGRATRLSFPSGKIVVIVVVLSQHISTVFPNKLHDGKVS